MNPIIIDIAISIIGINPPIIGTEISNHAIRPKVQIIEKPTTKSGKTRTCPASKANNK